MPFILLATSKGESKSIFPGHVPSPVSRKRHIHSISLKADVLSSDFSTSEPSVLCSAAMADLVSLGCWSLNAYGFNNTLAFAAIRTPGAKLETCNVFGRHYKYVGVSPSQLYCMHGNYTDGTPSDNCDVQCGNDIANQRTYWPGYVCGASASLHVNVYQYRPGEFHILLFFSLVTVRAAAALFHGEKQGNRLAHLVQCAHHARCAVLGGVSKRKGNTRGINQSKKEQDRNAER